MLSIYYGRMPEAIFNTAVYFKNVYEDSWITDPFSKEMILVLGKIAPVSLSGGVKTLMLINNEPQKIFNASTCGNNCAKWILKIGEMQDVTINLRHLMDFGQETFDIHILNTGQIVHNMKELVPIAGVFV